MKPTAADIEDFVRDLFHWLYIDYAHCVGYASPDDEYDFSPNPSCTPQQKAGLVLKRLIQERYSSQEEFALDYS